MLMQVSPGRHGGPDVVGFYDPTTSSIQYLVGDPATERCAVIDPILDYDPATASMFTGSADVLLDAVRERGFEIVWILDPHPHADHLTAAHYLKERTGGPIAIGTRVVEMQRLWRDIFGPDSFTGGGSEWDRLFDDGEAFDIGELACRVSAAATTKGFPATANSGGERAGCFGAPNRRSGPRRFPSQSGRWLVFAARASFSGCGRPTP